MNILPATHLRVRIREEVTEYLSGINSSEPIKSYILQLAYNLTADQDAVSLLAFSRETLPLEEHRRVRTFLAAQYPLLLTVAESESTTHARFATWANTRGDNQGSRPNGCSLSGESSRRSAFWLIVMICAAKACLKEQYQPRQLG